MEDFNLPSPERTALLERLQEAIGSSVPPHFWAACQICDLNALERLVKCGRECPGMLRNYAQQIRTMANDWAPVRSDLYYSPPGTPPAKSQRTLNSTIVQYRKQQARDLARQRDKCRCVLTGDQAIEMAYIYPYHLIKYKEDDIFGPRHMFWDHLGNFWSKDKIATWQAELFPAGICNRGKERVCNLITLSADVYHRWARGAFALKPVLESDDKKTLEVQFFWQTKQQDTEQTIGLLTTPISTKGLDENIGAYIRPSRLYNHSTEKRIQSGDYFKLQTDDPETKPLPSFQLLELQWFLQRIRGMAGAAEVDWPSLSESGSDISSDEEDIPDLSLDEVRDWWSWRNARSDDD